MKDPFDMTAAEIEDAYIKLSAERKEIADFLWPEQTGLPNEHRNILVAVKMREQLLREIIAKMDPRLTP